MAKVNNNIENIYPLTPLQEGMLFYNLYDKGSTAYVVQNVIKTSRIMDNDIIKKTLYILSQKYSVLRTIFVYEKVKSLVRLY